MRPLEVDPDLGRALPDQTKVRASREIIAEICSLAPGAWKPAADPTVNETPYGFLVLEGALVRRIAVGGRHSAELLGEGDFLRPQTPDSDEYAIVTQQATWQIIDEVQLALLSEDLINSLAVLPGVLSELATRAVQRSRSLALRMAIAQLPNLEQRLHLLLWHLADRWGRRERGTVVLPLRLTQGLLAELISAQRTSVNPRSSASSPAASSNAGAPAAGSCAEIPQATCCLESEVCEFWVEARASSALLQRPLGAPAGLRPRLI